MPKSAVTSDIHERLPLDAVARALDSRPGATRGGLPRWRLQRVVHHIEVNISGRLSICELASIAQMSASHFSRTFRETVGMSPHGYVTSRRVATAQQLIANKDYPLAEIAVLCGAADQAHLNRLFTKHCGVTPGVWRREAPWQLAETEVGGSSLLSTTRQ